MKRPIVFLIACLLGFVACKKREETFVEPIPKAKNLRLVEIVDSVDGSATFRNRSYYDEKGRITHIDINSEPLLKASFEYQNEMLSSVQSASMLTEISRDDRGKITSLYNKINDTLSLRSNIFYDQEGNLDFIVRLSTNSSSSTSEPDTTFYSNYAGGRFTVSSRIPPNNKNLKFETHKKYDQEGRILETTQIRKVYTLIDSGGTLAGEWLTEESYTIAHQYFPLSVGEKSFRDNMLNTIQQYYTPNLDVYEMIYYGNILPLDIYTQSTTITVQGATYRTSTSIIEKWNYHGLPTSILTTVIETEIEDPPIIPLPTSKSRMILRYEVD